MLGIRRSIDFLTSAICSLLLGAMIVIVAWQVISRYVLNDPSTYSEELLRFGVIWLSLIGAAYVAGKAHHMSVDLVKDMLSPAGQRVINIFIQLMFVAFAVGILIIGGMRAVNIAAFQYSAVIQMPMGLVYAALPVSGALMLVYSILNIIDLLAGRAIGTDPRLGD